MFQKPTWCCWKSVGLADQLLFCAQAGLPRDPETWDPGRDWRDTYWERLKKWERLAILQHQKSDLAQVSLVFQIAPLLCRHLPLKNNIWVTSEIVVLHLLQFCGFGKFALQKASKRIWAWSVLKIGKCTYICSKDRNWMKISPASCNSCAARPGAWSMLDTWACRQEDAP